MNNTGSFDVEINGIPFTFCPICSDNGQEDQISVMAEDYIFRMEHAEPETDYTFQDRTVVPSHMLDLEGQISAVLKAHDESRSI